MLLLLGGRAQDAPANKRVAFQPVWTADGLRLLKMNDPHSKDDDMVGWSDLLLMLCNESTLSRT